MDRTVKQAAEELGVGISWLYSKASTGEVPHQRYGRSVRFTAAQIEAIRVQYSQPVVTSRRLRGLGRAS